MKKVCAWCKKELSSPDTDSANADAPVSHGMCGDCARRILSYKAQPIRAFLDQFSKPVFLVNGEGRIVTGNSSALSLLGKKPDQVDGKLGGDAFGCKNAGLPGGCGNTVHCKSCTIRRTVLETQQTGKSNRNIPAYPDLHFMTGENRIRFLITTERAGGAVLLRIDEVTEENLLAPDVPAAAVKCLTEP